MPISSSGENYFRPIFAMLLSILIAEVQKHGQLHQGSPLSPLPQCCLDLLQDVGVEVLGPDDITKVLQFSLP